MTIIVAFFPGTDLEDAILVRQIGGSISSHADYLDACGITSPGLWRLDWPEDEKAPPVAQKLADLPPIPEIPC